MYKIIAFVAFVAVAVAKPGHLAETHTILQPAVVAKAAVVDTRASSAITHQSFTNFVRNVPVVPVAAPLVQTYHAAAPVVNVKTVEPVVPVVKTIAAPAPVVHTYAAAPHPHTVVKSVHAAPIVHTTYTAAAAAPLVHSVPVLHSVPVTYALHN